MDTDLLALVAETNRRGRRITAGKLTGQKPALKMKEVWAIRARLELGRRVRDLALFNLAIDSKLRGCDLVALKVEDVTAAGEVKSRGVVIPKKTGRPAVGRRPDCTTSTKAGRLSLPK